MHFQIKYLASDSFLSPYQCHILKMRKDDAFAFKNIATTTREMETERNLPDSVCGSPTPSCKKHQTHKVLNSNRNGCGDSAVNWYIALYHYAFDTPTRFFSQMVSTPALSYFFFANAYCTSSFEDCNSRPKISQKGSSQILLRVSKNRYSIACYKKFSADQALTDRVRLG